MKNPGLPSNQPMQRGNINDVARKAGVAASTVSRALSSHASIPSSTRERIVRIAEELGYKCNPIFSEMMSSIRSRTRPGKATFAYLNNEGTEFGWRTMSTFRGLIEGARQRAEELGFEIDLIWTRAKGLTARRLTKILLARGIQGILVGPSSYGRGHLSIDWENFSSMTLGHSIFEPRLHRVVNNQKQTVELALRKARSMGYRRPGLFLSKWQDVRCDLNFTAGYYALTAGKLPVIPPLLFDEMNKEVTKNWLTKFKPDVLLGSGIKSLQFLKGLDRSIGLTKGYVDLDLSEPDGSVAGIIQNHPIVGAAAVDLLIQQVSHSEKGVPKFPKLVLVEGTWADGATLKRRISANVAQ